MTNLMIYFKLFYEFAKVGLFAIGGGLATIPFLQDLSDSTGWFTQSELADMIAISESTPGPIGVNMASFAGFETAGILGAILATIGLITPSLVIIIIISKVLSQFKESEVVQKIFYGIRPASAALIAAAAVQVSEVAFTKETEMGNIIFPAGVALGLLIWGLMYYTPAKKLHPIFLLALSAVLGIFFV
ncbi:MAG: chromate transporter [Clostridia bacterium]